MSYRYRIILERANQYRLTTSTHRYDDPAFTAYMATCRIARHIVDGSAMLYEKDSQGNETLLSTYMGIQ